MKIILAENAGFCFGVKRALKIAFESANKSKNPIYSLGPLIHNPQQVEVLAQKGVHEISDFDKLNKGDILIIRSHGTSPDIVEKAKSKGIKIVDATCPFVVNAQKYAQTLYNEGYQVIIVGEGDHPEVIGIMGHVGNKAWIVEKPSDVSKLPRNQKIGVIAQTTQSFENFRAVVSALMEKSSELRIYNTICHATAQRQESALELAKKVDLMIVIGGHNSANTTRLAFLCKNIGVPTYHVETSDEIEESWLKGIQVVGITAGASTPEWIIEDIIKKINMLGSNEVSK